MRVKLHPDARAELRDARNWYYERSPLSAIAFAQTVDKAISKIREAPHTFPLADHGTRKSVLQRFPFNIFSRFQDAEIIIVAVALSEATTRLLVQSSHNLMPSGLDLDQRWVLGKTLVTVTLHGLSKESLC